MTFPISEMIENQFGNTIFIDEFSSFMVIFRHSCFAFAYTNAVWLWSISVFNPLILHLGNMMIV